MKTALIRKLPKTMVKLAKGVPMFCRRNSNWLLSALAILGVTGLTWAAIDGTIKAVKLCEEKQAQGAKEIIKTTWKLYIPMAGFFILTTVAIATNAKINAKRIATLTGLYAASQADIESLRKKMREVVGEKKATEIEMEQNKERVQELPPPKEDDIAKTGHGNMLFMDWLTGQYFRASPDYIELVEHEMNEQIDNELEQTLLRGYMQERFGERSCGTKDLYWDKADMVTRGIRKIELDASYTDWTEVNGQREMVAILRCRPEAVGF